MKLDHVNLFLITLINQLLDEVNPLIFLSIKRVRFFKGLKTLLPLSTCFLLLFTKSLLNNFLSLLFDLMVISLGFFLDAGELSFVIHVLQLQSTLSVSEFDDLLLDGGLYSGLMCSTYLQVNLMRLMLLKLNLHVGTYLAFVLLEEVLQGRIIVVTSCVHGVVGGQIPVASLETLKNLSWRILGIT